MSWPIAHAAFVDAAEAQLADPEPVVVLGIDETRRGRPRWMKDPEDGRWVKLETFETNFVDLADRADRGLRGASRCPLLRRDR